MKKNNSLTILAIETSCDDTCVAILKIKNQKLKILSNVVSSQIKIHAKYGGVYPALAKREHQKNLPIVLKKALKKAGNPKVNLIAVTIGPGLEPCLWAGINFAKELAEKLQVPIMPVNHIEAHILANFLPKISENYKLQIPNYKKLFPAICLVVSGGHTQLILINPPKFCETKFGRVKDFGKYEILGETRDDAAGECFDKTARILGLGYPGGPAIAEQARQWKSQIPNYKSQIKLPRPMIYQKNYDFSFSGLKTAVLYQSQKLPPHQILVWGQEMCYHIQQAIIDVLIYKTLKAAKDYKAKTIILGGGVSANIELRKQFKEKIEKEIPNSKFYIPDSKFCIDNAVMIGITAYFNWLKNKINSKKELRAEANLRILEVKNEKLKT